MFVLRFYRNRLALNSEFDFEISTENDFQIAIENWMAMHPSGTVRVSVRGREKRVFRLGWNPCMPQFWKKRICS